MREDFIKLILELGFQKSDNFGQYKHNNIIISMELYSRYDSVSIFHTKSKSFKLFTDYRLASIYIKDLYK